MIQFRLATKAEDIEQATTLVARKYAESGYVDLKENSVSGIAPYLQSTQSLTILAYDSTVLVGTVSLVFDGREGLPMDSIYRGELVPFRSKGCLLAEVCQFAVAVKSSTETTVSSHGELEVTVGLLAHVVRVAQRRGATHLVFTINPKHAPFYESLGCTRFGEEKEYPSVKNAPALAYVLILDVMLEGTKSNFLIEKIRTMPISESVFAAAIVSTQQ